MKVNDYFDKVVVINLDRRTDRMEQLDPQLKALGIEYERYSAIDGLAEGINPIHAGRMSHIEVMKQVTGKTLILEDDAYFVEGFQEGFDKVMPSLPDDWDIFYLGALVDRTSGKLTKVNEHWHRQVVSTGTQAYCVNPKKLDYFIEEQTKSDLHVDVCFRVLAEHTNAYITQPNLVTQFPSFSDLRMKEVNDF
jgi:GR25 family glycosyltransferase involved in LPS biosynthesis